MVTLIDFPSYGLLMQSLLTIEPLLAHDLSTLLHN